MRHERGLTTADAGQAAPALIALRIRRENAIAAEINAALASDPDVARWAAEHEAVVIDATRVACRLHDGAIPILVAERTRELVELAMVVGEETFRRAITRR